MTGPGTCSSCPSDSSSPAGSDEKADCTCNIKFYKASPDQCTACPAGSSSIKGSVELTACVCDPGRTGPNGGTCSICEAGKYKITAGSGSCTLCVAGKYSTESGAVSINTCKICQAGKYSILVGSGSEDSCENCQSGKYSSQTGRSSSTTCVACVKGKFSTTEGASSSGTCDECGAGKFSATEGASSSETCDECGAGKYSTVLASASSTTCIDCSIGKYSAAKGASLEDACSSCGKGKYSDAVGATSSSACVACMTGKFLPTQGSTSESACLKCDAGTFSADVGAVEKASCQACPLESTSVSGSDGITDCVCKNGYTGPNGGSCTPCESGQYKDVKGSAPCKSCGSGKTSSPGSTLPTDCQIQCPPGSTGPDGGSCALCSAGKYKTEAGTAQCMQCPVDATSPESSDSLHDCACNPGYTGKNGGDCTACSVGTYKTTQGSEVCLTCPAYSSSPAASKRLEACSCDAGYTGANGESCAACSKGQYKDTAGSETCKLCAEGTYKDAIGPGSCTACPSGASATVGSDKSADCLCKPGHTGPNGGMCTVCDAGKYKSESGSSECTACDTGTTSPAASTGAKDCTAVETPVEPKGPVPSVPVVRMTLGLPMTASEFTQDKQNAFQSAIAVVLTVNPEKVKIVSVLARRTSVRRRLLAESIAVMTEIDCDGDTNTAGSIKSKLSLSSINKQLDNSGLPQAQMLEAPEIMLPEESSAVEEAGSRKHVTMGAAIGAAAAFVLIGAAILVWLRRKSLRRSSVPEKLRGTAPQEAQSNLDFSTTNGQLLAGTETRVNTALRRPESVNVAWEHQCDISEEEEMTPPAQSGSNLVRMETLDIEENCQSGGTTSPPSASKALSNARRERLDDEQKMRDHLPSPRRQIYTSKDCLQARAAPPFMTMNVSEIVRSSKMQTKSVVEFDKDRISDMLTSGPVFGAEGAGNAVQKSVEADAAGSFEVLDNLGSLRNFDVSLDASAADQRSQATKIMARLREQGVLPQTDAKLVLLQRAQESTSSSVPQVASRLAGRRLGADTGPAPRPSMMSAAEPSATTKSFMAAMESSVNVSQTSSSSPRSEVGLPGSVYHSSSGKRHPPVDAWPHTLDSSRSSSSQSSYVSLLLQGSSKESFSFGSLGTNKDSIVDSSTGVSPTTAPLTPSSPKLMTPTAEEAPPAPAGNNPRPAVNAVKLGSEVLQWGIGSLPGAKEGGK